ncbi:zinc finger CCCH domain-containing protein 69, partial [Biomphalaria glabrata]
NTGEQSELDSPLEASFNGNESNVHNLEICPLNDSNKCVDQCPFIHGPLCHLCHMHRLHPFDPDLHLKVCLAKHLEQSHHMECNICFESFKDTKYAFGIQENCNHCFCIQCLRLWRQKDEMVNYRSCPVCRTPSGDILKFPLWFTCSLSKKLMFACKKRTLALEKYYRYVAY